MSNRFGHISGRKNVTALVPAMAPIHNYATGMVTKSPPPRRLLYLVEWRKYLNVKPEVIAEAFGIERESVHRVEREQHRMNAEKIAKYADALGILPEQLWRPPPREAPAGDTAELTGAERELALSLITRLTIPKAKPPRGTKPKR